MDLQEIESNISDIKIKQEEIIKKSGQLSSNVIK